MRPIIVIGDIVVDVTLKTSTNPYKLRLGGIVHAARGIWALGLQYKVGFFAPSYLNKNIYSYLKEHGCGDQIWFGEVTGAPFVFLIEEVKETGNQGYEFLLRDEIEIHYTNDQIEVGDDEIFLISGNYDLKRILPKLTKGNIHIDLANNVDDFRQISELGVIFSTIFISTSSNLFKNNFESSIRKFSEMFRPYCKRLVVKENRGGSRGFDFITNEMVEIPSQTQPIVHSVGVGDVYDVVYICHYLDYSFKEALVLSSWVASEYASTTFPDDFKKAVERLTKVAVSDLIDLGGVFVPWEHRKAVNIYIAGPDFDFMDTTEIDRLCDCLLYHNFSPRRPVKENGQMEQNANAARKKELFDKDVKLLTECKMLVAVVLNNDPGTFIEIGLAAGMNMPTIVYDPYCLVHNCMLSELPTMVSANLDEVLTEVFKQASKFNE